MITVWILQAGLCFAEAWFSNESSCYWWFQKKEKNIRRKRCSKRRIMTSRRRKTMMGIIIDLWRMKYKNFRTRPDNYVLSFIATNTSIFAHVGDWKVLLIISTVGAETPTMKWGAEGDGDAIGYKNGEWGEFCRSGVRIHESLEQLGGIEKIAVNPKEWMVSAK